MGAKAVRENLEFDDENTYLEDLPRKTSMDPQGLVQCIVKQGPVVPEFLL
jgi:hypothetical protein